MLQVVSKKELRKELLKIRRSLSPEQVLQKSKQIRDRVLELPAYKSANVIACYIAMPEEVQSKALIENSWKLKKEVVVPVTDAVKREIDFFPLDGWDGLIQGPYGIWQPDVQKNDAIDETQIDFVLVPGVGFDLAGNRLGFGAGYYDKFLSALTFNVVTVGLAFECQLTPEIPVDAWDKKMDFVITEERVIKP